MRRAYGIILAINMPRPKVMSIHPKSLGTHIGFLLHLIFKNHLCLLLHNIQGLKMGEKILKGEFLILWRKLKYNIVFSFKMWYNILYLWT